MKKKKLLNLFNGVFCLIKASFFKKKTTEELYKLLKNILLFNERLFFKYILNQKKKQLK